MRYFVIYIKLVILLVFPLYGGNGDPDSKYPDFPSWQERAVLTLTNACRMAPVAYRNKLLGDYEILLPANYPPVSPVYWNIDLNRVARLHSVNMANDCGLQHNSCDGTSTGNRIKSYYKGGYGWGENIASYYFSPQQTLQQWIMDDNRQGVPAPDNQKPDDNWHSGDGHRANIMSPGFNVLGVGYGTGPVGGGRWRPEVPYWTQDFGGGKTSLNQNPIAAGSHLFFSKNDSKPFEADSVTFAVGVYRKEKDSLTVAEVVVNGKHYLLKPWLMSGGNGTWSISLPKSDACRSYYFQCQYEDGTIWKYPEDGYLLSFGEGACKTDYTPTLTQNIVMFKNTGRTGRETVNVAILGKNLMVQLLNIGCVKQWMGLEVVSSNGKRIMNLDANKISGDGMYIFDVSELSKSGIYFVSLKSKDGSSLIGSKFAYFH